MTNSQRSPTAPNDEVAAVEEGTIDTGVVAGVTPLQQDSNSISIAIRPHLTLAFENLTVHVPGDSEKCCNCISNPFKNYIQEYMGISLEEREPFYALDDVSGVVSSGEFCLVLGVNEISKSTLLRALSGRLNEHDEMHGTMTLNGVPLSNKSQQGWRKLTPYVSASDASHSPVLTVRETLTFAADCVSADGDSKHRVDRLLDLLGLAHVADTVIGDDNLRGVSGGQKRRVTVGEMMTDTKNTAVFCFENITDGLASTDSYSLLQHMQRTCKELHQTGIVSLLQPSDEMVRLFDKLLVLGPDGELAYFGPVDREALEDIFLEANQDPPGSLADMVLRKSLIEADSRKSQTTQANKFRESKPYKALSQQLSSIRSNRKKATDLADILPKTKYSTSGWHQFQILCNRRHKLIARNAVTYTRVGIAILFGIIIGSLFGGLNFDLMGSLGRTGYMFLNSFLVLMLSSAVVLPEGFRQRPTLFKHRSAEFFSGRIAYLAQVLMDIPLAIVEAILLASISYFWVDMQPTAGKFFYFLSCLIGLEFVGQAFGRLLCALFRKQVSANAMSTVVIIGWGSVAGFMPNYDGINLVLRWLSWVTPVSYSFEGMMLNEFSGRDLSLIVVGAADEVSIGSLGGDAWLSIFSLPRSDWGSEGSIKAFNVCVLFMMAIAADLFGLYYVELTRSWYHNQTRRPQSRVKSLEMATEGPQRLMGSSKSSSTATPVKAITSNDEWPVSLAVRSLSYHVPFKNQQSRLTMKSLLGPCLVRLSGKTTAIKKPKEKEITLLYNVEARFSRGRMCALMGSSGAGKTTLLDVIAGYKTGGRIAGDVMIDGFPKEDKIWKRISGYAEQNDILNPYLSSLETLRFTAACRLPGTIDREAIINKVVKLMDLKEWLDVVVGRELEGEGLPKHARKRLTIAVQLVVQPRILFLDEPTTGLGTNAAALVISSIRRATDVLGLITLATIHQPSTLIWDTFDDLLLLAKGGRVSYMGEMGPKSQTVLNHFTKLSEKEPPPSCNPADYVLSALTSVEAEEAVAVFEGSVQKKAICESINLDLKQQSSGKSEINLTRANSQFMEIMLLSKRQLITQWRNPSYTFMRLISSILVSLYMGALFYGDKSTISGAVFSIGSIFFLVFVLVIPMAAAVVPLIEDRAVLYRETVSGTYSRLSYGIGSLIADIPFHILNTLLMFVSFYFLVGFSLDGEIVGYFILMLFLANWVIMSMGQLYALVSPNEESAHGLAGLSVILSVILMGFLITVSAMPSGWTWAYWANLFHYILQGLVSNELVGKIYHLNLDFGASLVPEKSMTNVSNIVLFQPGIDGMGNDGSLEAATLLSIIGAAGNGTNPDSAIGDVIDLLTCFGENDCMDSVPVSLMFCIAVPCKKAFEAAVATFPVEEVVQCFEPGFEGNATMASSEMVRGAPSDFSIAAYEALEQPIQWGILLCLIRAFLPPAVDEIISRIIGFIKQNWGLIVILVDVLKNGINLPGELILFFFGWAKFEDGSFQSDLKWHYCMTSVVVFLLVIEIFKLIAVRFIVWTKR